MSPRVDASGVVGRPAATRRKFEVDCTGLHHRSFLGKEFDASQFGDRRQPAHENPTDCASLIE
jgi:hypothetical protein